MKGIALLLFVLASTLGCRRSTTTPKGVTNVLLVTIDTLRADHLGCYGHAGAATPTLDALAARGVRFATAVAHVPLTGPSHASILTGLLPLGHGFRDNGGFVLPPQVGTAAEAFAKAGYRTGAFVSGFPLDRRFGLNRGFEVYDDHLPRGNDRRRTPYVERFADATTDVALRFLESPPKEAKPFFVWVHYYDPHAPYEPPADLATRFASLPYDGEIAFVDRQIARLIGSLEKRGEVERTVVLVTADHGESLGEHGEGTHGLFLYDATLRVPFILAGPGVARGHVNATVARGIDVFPTLLELTGQPPRPEVEGRSLRPALEGREMSDAPAYAESLYPLREYGWAPLHAWRTARFKFIEAPRPELYDLQADPREGDDRIAKDAAQAEELRVKLRAALARPVTKAEATLDAETAERLVALGYLGGGGTPNATVSGNGRDPKDGARLLPRLNHGIGAARTEPERAIRELTSVLADDPDLVMARRGRAVAYEASGQFALAIAELRRLEKEGHLGAEDGVMLGDSLRFSGRLDEAMQELEKTALTNPKFAQPWLSMAEIHIRRGRNADAAKAYEHVLGLVPDQIEALRGLGDLALLEGKPAAAATRYERILAVDPADSGAMTKLGVVRMQTGRPGEALSLLQKAVERAPKDGDALLYLAGALAAGGRAAEAVPYFERALAAGKPTTMAWNGLALTRASLGDTKGAAAAFRESLRLDPKQPEIVQALRDVGPP